ncbi:MAG: ribonuclease P protein component [Crocinitomicaceae bacterium]|nr:ribonuclease P protein component [Crocinitomicaceae bacterium]
MVQTFPAAERIKSRTVLETVYEKGEQIIVHPFRIRFMRYNFEEGAAVKFAVSVPKRNVKKAVRRNRLKRQIKEAYRLNKKGLLSQINDPSQGLALFLIYIGKDDQTYQALEDKMKLLLDKLQQKL